VVRVNHHVCLESLWLGEGLVAVVTLVAAVRRVDQQVALHVGTLVEAPPTNLATVGSQACVGELVRAQVMLLQQANLLFMVSVKVGSCLPYLRYPMEFCHCDVI
jgi:hypothetical protein